MQKAERHNDNANDHKWLNNRQESTISLTEVNFNNDGRLNFKKKIQNKIKILFKLIDIALSKYFISTMPR